MSAAARLAAIALLAAACLLLGACGGPAKPDLESPRVSIAELELESGTAAVRFDNPVAAPLPATRADFTITIAGEPLGLFTPTIGLTIPPLGSELVRLDVDPDSAGARRLRESRRERVGYRVTGSLGVDDGPRLDIESEGWLYPNPGKPGSFR